MEKEVPVLELRVATVGVVVERRVVGTDASILERSRDRLGGGP
jgi:hypothetical protein